MLHIPQGYAGDAFQRIKICKIGNPRYPDDRNIDQANLLLSLKPFCQAVFILHLDIQIRCHSHHGNAASRLQHLYSGIQDRLITPEFIDDQAFHHGTLVLLQEHYRADQLGKHATAVNISHQKDRRLCHFRHSHIHDIIAFQVDFCRASCPFDHNNVILLR